MKINPRKVTITAWNEWKNQNKPQIIPEEFKNQIKRTSLENVLLPQVYLIQHKDMKEDGHKHTKKRPK